MRITNKVLFLLLSLMLLISVSSCKSKTIENYYYKTSDTFISIGEYASTNFSTIFIPSTLNDYTVISLGFKGKKGCLNNSYIKKIFVPNTVTNIYPGYLKNLKNIQVNYVGEVIDLSLLGGENINVIVEFSEYIDFCNACTDNNYKKNIKYADIVYYYNNGTTKVYTIDFVEENNKIEYMPPAPLRDGYTFTGWYKDANCKQSFDFDSETILMEQEEIAIFAGWKKN